MRSVNTQFALFYNKQKERVGYVFRDRFLSEPIKNEKHLYNCISYIHMNPVAANIVSRPNEYHYSSYNDFINKNGIVTDSVLIKLFGNSEKYIELFHIIHMSMGEGMEYLDDSGGVTLEKSQRIVRNILYDYGLKEEALNNDNICKYFYKKFIKNGVKKYHIEQIFNVNRRKINSILKT